MRKVVVVPHDPQWRLLFETESIDIIAAFGKNAIVIHHIGSTSIPGIYAKPIIDFLVEAQDLVKIDIDSDKMKLLGYRAMGEFGIPDRRFFCKDNQFGIRTHHVHVFESGSGQVKRNLAFRDYLIAHPDAAQEYSDLKRKLAQIYPLNIELYQQGKAGFIQEIDRKAVDR
jgi:GrpB-like predicted nucleotidyltransferase (UPF0157 family)